LELKFYDNSNKDKNLMVKKIVLAALAIACFSPLRAAQGNEVLAKDSSDAASVERSSPAMLALLGKGLSKAPPVSIRQRIEGFSLPKQMVIDEILFKKDGKVSLRSNVDWYIYRVICTGTPEFIDGQNKAPHFRVNKLGVKTTSLGYAVMIAGVVGVNAAVIIGLFKKK
jgi:hypothetical protein